MSVEKKTRSPRFTSVWYATSRAIETRKPPWTCSAPFGRPVVPDVYARRYGASESTCSGSSVPGCFVTSSGQPLVAAPHEHRRAAVVRLLERREHVDALAAAVGPVGADHGLRLGVLEPRRDRRRREAGEDRHLHRADVRARVRRDRDRRAHRQEDRDAVALARRRARRAPPRPASPAARARATSAPSRVPSSPRNTAASPGRSRQRWTQFAAMFSRAPTNHFAHSGPSDDVEHALPRLRELEPEIVDQLGPEALRLLDRDAMQLVVVGTTEPPHAGA